MALAQPRRNPWVVVGRRPVPPGDVLFLVEEVGAFRPAGAPDLVKLGRTNDVMRIRRNLGGDINLIAVRRLDPGEDAVAELRRLRHSAPFPPVAEGSSWFSAYVEDVLEWLKGDDDGN